MTTTTIADDIETECPACGEPRRQYTCRRCGVSAQLINCGHYAQPRPISGLTGETLCDACAWADTLAREEAARLLVRKTIAND